jgi:hypothetical protein
MRIACALRSTTAKQPVAALVKVRIHQVGLIRAFTSYVQNRFVSVSVTR